jgi:hypothetical protein
MPGASGAYRRGLCHDTPNSCRTHSERSKHQTRASQGRCPAHSTCSASYCQAYCTRDVANTDARAPAPDTVGQASALSIATTCRGCSGSPSPCKGEGVRGRGATSFAARFYRSRLNRGHSTKIHHSAWRESGNVNVPIHVREVTAATCARQIDEFWHAMCMHTLMAFSRPVTWCAGDRSHEPK